VSELAGYEVPESSGARNFALPRSDAIVLEGTPIDNMRVRLPGRLDSALQGLALARAVGGAWAKALLAIDGSP
jgi:hypothetical protein